MEESKQFQPEYGKEYEFSNTEATWRKQIFIGMNPIENLGFKYITVDVLGRADVWKHIRPIRRTLEEKVEDHLEKYGHVLATDTIQQLIEIIANHQLDVTDEEIEKQFIKECDTMGYTRACIRTVRHFTTLKWKG